MGQEDRAASPEREQQASGVWSKGRHPSNEPSSKVFDRAATRIAHVRRLGSIASARHVGAIVVEEIFRGDLSALRDKGPKRASLRKLASHPKTNLSPSTLSRAVGVFVICQRMPGFREPKHLEVGHLYAVLGLDDAAQEKLLRMAEIDQWPREKLEAKVAEMRPNRDARHARPAIMWHVASLRRAVSMPLPGVDGGLPEDSLAVIEEVLTDVERRVEELRKWLDAARDRRRGVSR